MSLVGKPFDSELQQLTTTISWSCEEDITSLKHWVARSSGEPLFAVGVGGSLTSATLVARLHERTGGFAAARTTLDFTTSTAALRGAHVMILTGSGRNRDVLSALDHAVAAEAKSVLVVCATKGSKVAARARKWWDIVIFEFAPPSRRDGFLATNSLLATCIVLCRAFGKDVSTLKDWHLSDTLRERGVDLVSGKRETILALHSGWGTPAAVDLESKCSEAGLRAVLLCDYRHFAHGRHQWLATHAATSAVVAFVTPKETQIAERTMRLLPDTVSVVRLETRLSDGLATADLLLQEFQLVAGLGRALGIDPGRPGVPEHGGRIYHLRAQVESPLLRTNAANVRTVAMRRKEAASAIPADWGASYDHFVDRLSRTRFSAVVFDFDGTLCGSQDRFRGLSDALKEPIVRLVEAGVHIGVATGRGQSARKALQEALPRSLWAGIFIGYHNGTEVASLANDSAPDTSKEPTLALRTLYEILRGRGLEERCKLDLRPMQLTIEPHAATDASGVATVVNEAVAKLSGGLRLVHSSHSFDVLAQAASKLNVVAACQKGGEAVLCLGDRGAWPGNDFEMLATPFSLSVDTVSADLHSCWNLAPVGVRCVQATAFYLSGMKADSGTFRFSLSRSLAWFRAQNNHE